MKTIEIMDTTLRDGEQTSGVSFMPHEKLIIAKALLQNLCVDRIEVASARVSEGEKEAVKNICRWARQTGRLPKVEVLGFVDGHTSIDWIVESGCQCVNLLCKGSLRHCEGQLKKSLAEHVQDILATVAYATEQGLTVNLYLEDWSNGMKDSPQYVFDLVEALRHCGIRRFMLPDTLGVLNPLDLISFMRQMVKRFPGQHFDFHAHNDYDLAISNVLAAVLGGASGIHTSVNGLGERAGNAPLASVQAILRDQFHAHTGIDESRLNEVSRLVESYSGIAIPPNQPITGENVFTQVAGVHADGDNKAGLYQNALLPERFGRKREYALGKNSGKANILRNLEELGLELTPEQTKRVTERIIELGDAGGSALHSERRAQAWYERGACAPALLCSDHRLRTQAAGKPPPRGQRTDLRGKRTGRWPVRCLRESHTAHLQEPSGPPLSLAHQLWRVDSSGRTHGCLCADNHHLELGQPPDTHTRLRCRPDRSGHQGHHQDAQPHRAGLLKRAAQSASTPELPI